MIKTIGISDVLTSTRFVRFCAFKIDIMFDCCNALCRLQDGRIHMAESDFVNITRNGDLCNAKGEIGMREFEAIMRREVMSYLQTRLTDFSTFRTGEDMEFTQLGAIKTILSSVLVLAEEQRTANKDMRDMLLQIKEGLPGVAGSSKMGAIPDVATKALQSGMETLAVDLKGIRSVIQQHIAALGQTGSTQHRIDLPPPLPRQARATSSSPTVESAFSEPRSRQRPRRAGSVSRCNDETGLGALSSTAGLPAFDGGLSGSTPSASSDAPEGPIQPAARRSAGRQGIRSSSPLMGRPTGTASDSTAASACEYDCQGKLRNAHVRKRRASTGAATAATKAKSTGSDKAGRPPLGRVTGSVSLAGPAMFKMLAAAAEHSGPSSSGDPSLAFAVSAPSVYHAPKAYNPAAHSSVQNQNNHPPAALGEAELEGHTAYPDPLASSVCRQLQGEVVLVPSNRFHQQSRWRRPSQQQDPLEHQQGDQV
jgi:hypothetical protein